MGLRIAFMRAAGCVMFAEALDIEVTVEKPKGRLKMTTKKCGKWGWGICLIAGVAASTAPSLAAAQERFKLYGDISEAISINMQTPAETADAPQKSDDKHKLSMARTTLRVGLDTRLSDDASFVVKARGVKELNLGYLKNLQKLGANAAAGGDLAGQYSEVTLREAYLDWKLGDRFQARLGKQQVAWGETDFFQAMDLVQGYDFTWRSFLEPDNEELRKSLVMANLTVHVPEADGKLQVLIRPGKLNRQDAVGNTFDIFGGRWANQPYKGLDFRTITPYNYHHEGADADDLTGGLRWSGMAHDINYSVSLLKTYNPSPVISPRHLGPGSNMTPFKGATPTGALGNIIYPTITAFGVTASGYSAAADGVFSAEAVYIKDYAYNFGYSNAVQIPGFNGVKQKDLVRTMVRMDKNLAFTQSLLGTEQPAFFSVQIFNSWIQDYDRSEDLLQLVGFGQASKEHSTLVTGILDLSYRNGDFKPNLVVGWDPTYGGGFLVPSVSYKLGKDWRLKVEYDHFWNRGARTTQGSAERNTALFGYFDNNDQLYIKLAYQF
jgi:hypothetical protein